MTVVAKRMALTAFVLLVGSFASPGAAIVLLDGRVSPAAVSSLQNAGGTVRLEQPRLETRYTVPEPRALVQVVSGTAFLALLARRRRPVTAARAFLVGRDPGGTA